MIKNRVADLTIDEFRAMMREEFRMLIRQTVRETLQEVIGKGDSDEGSEFKPEIAERLRRFMSKQPVGEPLKDNKE